MIEIHKPVKRLTRHQYGVLRRSKLRKIVVSLEPDDLIVFKEHRSRKKFSITIDSAFHYVVRAAVEAERRKKLEARRAKKCGR